jgi:hypothetical protein
LGRGATCREDGVDQFLRHVVGNVRILIVECALPELDALTIAVDVSRTVHTPSEVPFELLVFGRRQFTVEELSDEFREFAACHNGATSQ